LPAGPFCCSLLNDRLVWGRGVRDYKVYVLSPGDHIKSAPRILKCEDDAEAVYMARQLIEGLPLEIWEGARIVTKVSPDK
jgi:hypothetical protein